MFYPDIRGHISPSAIATWHNNKSGFIRSYFKGERNKETSAMIAGTQIHALIEGGFLSAQLQYENNEVELNIPFQDTGVVVKGKPDSDELRDETAYFLDYKTGRDVTWTREELAKDLKMRATAWLVWQKYGKPNKVYGFIAWIGTEWNGEEVVPTPDEYSMVKYCYTAAELQEFENVIQKTIDEVNEAYERFNAGTTDFVDAELCREFADLDKQVKEIEAAQITPLKERMDAIKERLSEQLEFGNADSFETEAGTFYWRNTKKYAYPDTLEFQLPSGELYTLGLGEQIAASVNAAKKGYEAGHDPVEEKKSLQFRAKKVKK